MNVLFVNSANKKKRISPFILSQAQSLQQNGISVDFYSLDQGGLKGYIKHTIKLRKLLKQKSYDVIHAHYALMGFISSFVRRNEKLIVSLMGCDILGSYNSNGKLIIAYQPIVWAAKFFSRFLWDFVILKSRNMEKKLWSKTKYQIIPNGVDLKLFNIVDKEEARKRLGLSLSVKYVLFPTNPKREEKNFPLAQKAFDFLKNNYDKIVELLIVHQLTYDELVLYYNAVDLCIMTSFSEGSPNVIKECMACNLPIVSTDIGDVNEIIVDTAGCFIGRYDPDDFANKMKKALDFNHRTNGRKKVQHLEINFIAKRLIEIYKSLL